MSTLPLPLLRMRYDDAAQAYLRSLPLEHFMESPPQATQRKITLESLDVVHAHRPDVHTYNELLIQYPLPDDRIGQVVPDNMVVVAEHPPRLEGSYDLPFQPVRPLVVMEYVSKTNRRKDYETNLIKYETHVRAAYYLMFVPDVQELTLYKLGRKKFAAQKPNDHGRCAIPELELEVALLDRWVRYWFRGELVPLPADLLRDLNQARREVADARRELDQERATRQDLEAELARLRALLAQQPPLK